MSPEGPPRPAVWPGEDRFASGLRGCPRAVFRPDRPDRDDYIRSALQGIRLNAGAQPEVIRAIIDLAHNLVSLLPEYQAGREDSLRREVHLLLQQPERELPDDVKLLRRRAEKHGLVPEPGD